MVTINVKVTGGIAPIPVMVDITNLDTKQNLKFESDKSFAKSFNVDLGRCTIIVSGMNPDNGKTEITISGSFKDGPHPSVKKATSKAFYSQLFFGVI
jgi:hypothetical protein